MTDFYARAHQYTILIEGGPTVELVGVVTRPPRLRRDRRLSRRAREMLEAIAFHLEGMQSHGDPIPEGTGPGVYVARPDSAA